MPNAMIHFGDVRGLLYVWDMIFSVFLFRGGEKFEIHSSFFCFFDFDNMI